MLEKQKTYKYETHLHTSEASACAGGTGAEMARAWQEAGYSGIIVTDHFFNGNTSVSSRLSWENRVEKFCKGYENAFREGVRCGLHVFFGWEYNYCGTEFLTYGLDRQFLLDHPDMLSWSLGQYFQKVRQHGGFISHAHPFRRASYIRDVRLFPDQVDAVEVVNASHTDPAFNRQALEYARKHQLLMTSGSDAHNPDEVYGGGIAFTREIHSMDEFIQAMRASEGHCLHLED